MEGVVQRSNQYKIAGLIIALVLPFALVFIPFHLFNNVLANMLCKETAFWALFAGLYFVMTKGERKPFSELGTGHNFGLSLGLGVLTLIVIYVFVIFFGICYVLFTHSRPPHEPVMDKIATLPIWFKLLLAIRAGIIEETFFRGYAITRLQQLTGNRIIAIVLPLILFAAGHIAYGTVYHFLAALIIGIVLTASYLKTNNLVANIIAHILFDAFTLMALSLHH